MTKIRNQEPYSPGELLNFSLAVRTSSGKYWNRVVLYSYSSCILELQIIYLLCVPHYQILYKRNYTCGIFFIFFSLKLFYTAFKLWLNGKEECGIHRLIISHAVDAHYNVETYEIYKKQYGAFTEYH